MSKPDVTELAAKVKAKAPLLYFLRYLARHQGGPVERGYFHHAAKGLEALKLAKQTSHYSPFARSRRSWSVELTPLGHQVHEQLENGEAS